MTLEQILKKFGINLRNNEGELRNVVDVLEDMYLKMSASEFNKMMFEIMEEEKEANVFDNSRGREYRGV